MRSEVGVRTGDMAARYGGDMLDGRRTCSEAIADLSGLRVAHASAALARELADKPHPSQKREAAPGHF